MTAKQRTMSEQVRDVGRLVAAALIVCLLAVGAFAVAEVRHLNPFWVFLPLISIGFIAAVREEYRKQFRSAKFVVFVGVCVVLNAALFVTVLSLFGWLYLIPVLLLEQFFFYLSAYWLFGVPPPAGRAGADDC